MKTNFTTRFCLILTLAFLFHAGRQVNAAELITNGGFENATAFQGWTVVTSGNGWFPWQVTAAGGGDGSTGGITTSSPLFGTRSAWTGFCCNTVNNPEYIQQDITIPAANTATFIWSDKIQSNLTTFCSTAAACGSNTWQVQILNTSNTVLQTVSTFTALGLANYNTGWITHNVSLNAYAGQTIRIRFSGTYVSTINGLFNGPGRAEVDGVSVNALPVLAANVSVGGRITTAEGRGIRNAMVNLVDASGNIRRTITSPFGYYSFTEVASGETYLISVASRRFTFENPTRVITVVDEVQDLDFVANSEPQPRS